jgi:hypothetical protein
MQPLWVFIDEHLSQLLETSANVQLHLTLQWVSCLLLCRQMHECV